MPFEICSMADTKLHCKVKVAFNHKYFFFFFLFCRKYCTLLLKSNSLGDFGEVGLPCGFRHV
jgi:hypothetical protein